MAGEEIESGDDEEYSFTVEEEEHVGGRLDKVLSSWIDDLSRARIQSLIQDGQVLVNGKPAKSTSQKLAAGDVIELSVPPPVDWHPQAQHIPLDIMYEDADLLVINKQAGLVVHPGAGNHDGTLVNALLHHCGDDLSGIGGVLRPGIVHRLDKDTSGLMVVAKSDKAHQGLSAQFSDRSLSRTYVALVLGVPMPLKGAVDRPIGRHPSSRQKMAVNHRNGKEARTYYTVIERYRNSLALVQCKLDTGRTHQIRVHMADMKHPLIGDPAYGSQPTAVQSVLKKAGYDQSLIDDVLQFPRQMLHAKALSFVHPVTGEAMDFEGDIPQDMRDILERLP